MSFLDYLSRSEIVQAILVVAFVVVFGMILLYRGQARSREMEEQAKEAQFAREQKKNEDELKSELIEG